MANKDVIESRETDHVSIRSRIYKELFSQARYAYELRDRAFPSASHTKGQSIDHWRISVLSSELLIDHFSLREVASRQGYSTSFETEDLTLPVGSSATLERLDHENPDSSGTLYLITSRGALQCYLNVSEEEVPHYICDHFIERGPHGAPFNPSFRPRFSTSYSARLMTGEHEQGQLWCVIEEEVKYICVKNQLCLARESHARVYWLTPTPDLSNFKSIPLSSRFWMGEYHYKRFHRYPCSNELPGYEYEAKLSPKSLSIDESLLPFKVIERYQTESARWYLESGEGRLGFREGRASVVKKGKKVAYGLVLKRKEQKTQGLSMWDFTAQDDEEYSTSTISNTLQMRRIKRQLYLYNPKSQRVFALCLDDCRVEGKEGQPLLQLELEYNGKLCLPLETFLAPDWLSFKRQVEAASMLADEHPKAALRCIERAVIIAAHRRESSTAHDLKALDVIETRIKETLEKAINAERRAENVSINTSSSSKKKKKKKKKKERSGQKSAKLKLSDVELEVFAEMTEVIESLIEHHSCEPTTLTKRKWLKSIFEVSKRS